jgi:hypothetical protein
VPAYEEERTKGSENTEDEQPAERRQEDQIGCLGGHA